MHATSHRGDSRPHDDVQGMENPSAHGCGPPFSSLDYCNFAVSNLHFPASSLQTVRMESDSCDALAFCIDDPACPSCHRDSASCHLDAIIRPIRPGITLFLIHKKEEKTKPQASIVSEGDRALHVPCDSTRMGSSTCHPFIFALVCLIGPISQLT